MKLSLYLSIIALAVTATLPQAASAQESGGARPGGARFNYAPNVFRIEQPRLPKGYGERAEIPHSVQAGAVPSNALGLDNDILQKPAPVVAQAPVVTTAVTPRVSVPIPRMTFNPMFGKPQEATPIAHLPVQMPMQAVAKPNTIAPVVAKSAPAAPKHSATHVAATLLTPVKRHTVVPASATPAVASYGKNFGYTPGPFLPSSGGMSTSTSLSGVVLNGHRKH